MTANNAKPNQVSVVKCPCGHRSCSYYGLSDGSFHQGTGWDHDTAQFYADARNVYHETGLTPSQLAERVDKLGKDYIRAAEISSEQLRLLSEQRAELLAALKGVLGTLLAQFDYEECERMEVVQIARAAFAKCKGETP